MSNPEDKQDRFAPSKEPIVGLNFLDSCRAGAIGGIAKYTVCLTPPPQNCVYAFPYGSAYYCSHPRCQEIAARTLKTGENRTA